MKRLRSNQPGNWIRCHHLQLCYTAVGQWVKSFRDNFQLALVNQGTFVYTWTNYEQTGYCIGINLLLLVLIVANRILKKCCFPANVPFLKKSSSALLSF